MTLLSTDQHEDRIRQAIASNDAKTLAYYENFKTKYREGEMAVRQMALNAWHMERAIQFGFTQPLKPDEYGWMKCRIDDLIAVEQINLWEKDISHVRLSVAELPNRRWISGLDVMFSNSGCLSGCGLHSTQFSSKVEALADSAKRIIQFMDGETAETIRQVKQAITALFCDLNQPIQLELF